MPGNYQRWGVILIWKIVGQGPTVLSVSAGGGCLNFFSLTSVVSLFFLPLSGRQPVID